MPDKVAKGAHEQELRRRHAVMPLVSFCKCLQYIIKLIIFA